jgi:hypothetical protein
MQYFQSKLAPTDASTYPCNALPHPLDRKSNPHFGIVWVRAIDTVIVKAIAVIV